MTRASRAGILIAEGIIEMTHLMYQRNTALHFLRYLMSTIAVEVARREKELEVSGD